MRMSFILTMLALALSGANAFAQTYRVRHERGIFTDENEPDLYVVYHTKVDGEFKITGGYSLDWRGADAIAVNSYVAGTLVIDLVDAADNQLIWRATASATINPDPKKNRETVRKALDKMFAGFPPRK